MMLRLDYWVLGLLCGIMVIVALPPHWDPAIRLRQWLEERRTKGRK